MSDLWLPGPSSVDDFVVRLQQRVARFAERHGLAQAMVEVELRDGPRLRLDSIAAEPGQGFVTLCPHPETGGDREELIVPLASIALFRIAPTEEEPRFGFALSDEAVK